ncbi:tRNA pseudouridine(38-40) synthase TruA [Curtobacterium ammoniigenes]|uniref:tRNA pseudouridine(38-40) synthase TruA n=1 Tax=Curtobacterium ammoniigenes TaxID=395387 RepID=UPI001FE03F71|nr:tRNA pseudouridine(38-40) synthase TruA [Curtobacterium ammoniigenes]
MNDVTGAVRLRLDIAYDGSGFSGWARQTDLRTVQGVLEAALATIVARHGAAPTITVAGRTDAGVHAIGQVAHVDLDADQWASLRRPHRSKGAAAAHIAPESALRKRLNGIAGLDSDVVVTRISIAPAGFDARFSPIWRRYEYRVADTSAVRDPRRRGHTLWYPAALDERAMEAAALTLLGLHDFATFCKPRDGATTIRTLQEFRWTRDADGVLVAALQADAFCHSMVRAMVGGALAVGEGTLEPSALDVLRRAETRTSAFKVAPAKGLTLVEVGYPPDDELAARAQQTRARRASPGTGVPAVPTPTG